MFALVFIWIGALILISIIEKIFNAYLYYDIYILLFGVINTVFFLSVLIQEFNKKRDKYIFGTIMTSFLLRICLMFIEIKFYSFPMDADKGNFERMGHSILNGEHLYTSISAYYFAFIMKVFGDNEFITQLIHVIFAGISMLFFNRILEELVISLKYRRIGMLLFSFMPYYLMQSVCYMRESVIVLLLTLSIYEFIYWNNHKTNISMVWACVWALCASGFHGGCIAFIVGYIFTFYLTKQKSERNHFVSQCVLSFGLIFLFIISVTNYRDIFFGKISNVSSMESLINQAERQARGGAAYHISETGNIMIDLFGIGVLRMIMFLIVPVNWRGLTDVCAFIFSSSYYLLSLGMGIVLFLKIKDKNKSIQIIFVIFIITSYIFGWGVSNSGTALRHRDKLFPVATILLVYSFDKLSNQRMKSKEKIEAKSNE